MRVVNFFGGPGSGKSTQAAGLFYHMKLKGYNVELVTEYSKDLLYSGQLESMYGHQETIYGEQNYRLLRLWDKVDWAITDSPILLSAVYPLILRENYPDMKPWPAMAPFREMVRCQFNTYDNLNIWLKRPDEQDYQVAGRMQSKGEAIRADELIWTELMMTCGQAPKIIELSDNTVVDVMEYLEIA